MSWFWLSLIALLFWSGSDTFSKLGCRDAGDKYGYLKMVTAVGTVMGLHAFFEIFVNKVDISFSVVLAYLPVSLFYISSMALGYLALRYIELSISSPICNASGAIVAVICLAAGGLDEGITGWAKIAVLGAVFLVCAGVIGLGIVDFTEDDEARNERQKASNYRYAKSWIAILIPVLYCLLDAAGTYADSVILETLDENSANCAYELTFLLAGFLSFVYVKLIRKQSYLPKAEGWKYAGALCETAGQFAYIFALADSEHVVFTVPIISAYCAASVLWSRLFLKEKLSPKHYLCVLLIVIGIVVLGVFDL